MANDSLILEFMSRVADLEAEVKNLKNTNATGIPVADGRFITRSAKGIKAGNSCP